MIASKRLMGGLHAEVYRRRLAKQLSARRGRGALLLRALDDRRRLLPHGSAASQGMSQPSPRTSGMLAVAEGELGTPSAVPGTPSKGVRGTERPVERGRRRMEIVGRGDAGPEVDLDGRQTNAAAQTDVGGAAADRIPAVARAGVERVPVEIGVTEV